MSRTERLEVFATFPERLGGLALAAMGRPTPPDEWGPAEVVSHLIAVEDEVHFIRLQQVATGDAPFWESTEPGLAAAFAGARLDEVLEAFSAARAASVRFVRALDDDGWARRGTHATFGTLDVEGLLRVASDHDTEHLAGLAEP